MSVPMFGLLGWETEYEPIDLGGYIPDFYIKKTNTIVEVKPILQFTIEHTVDQDTHVYESPEVTEVINKINNAGWDGDALIVGAVIDWDDLMIGTLGEIYDPHDKKLWFSDCQIFWCRICNSLSFFTPMQVWRCRMNGCYDSSSHIDQSEGVCKRVKSMWNQAGNMVQWKSPRQ